MSIEGTAKPLQFAVVRATRDRRARSRGWSGTHIGVAAGLLLGIVAALAAESPPPVAAHPEYLRSDPPAGSVAESSPTSVTITFTEPIENRLLDIAVLTESGQRVDGGDARRLEGSRQAQVSIGNLSQGAYTVRWRALGYDGHIVTGGFNFGIGRPPPAQAPAGPTRNPVPDAVIRWVTLLSAAVLVGGVFFRQLVLAPALRSGEIDADSAQYAEQHVLTAIWTAFAVFVGASVAVLAAQALAAGRDGGFIRLADVLLGSRFGQLWIARMVLLTALGAVLARIEGMSASVPAPSRRQTRLREAAWRNGADRWWMIATVISAALALPFSLGGHAAVSEPSWLAIPVDWAHRLAALAWVGGLVHFVALWLAGASGRNVSSAIAGRFSGLTTVSFAVLVPTGLYSAWANLPSPAETSESAYGITLLVKLGLAVPMAALGLWHWHATQGKRGALRAQTLMPEVVFGALTLAAVGLLVNLPPGRGESAAREAATSSVTAQRASGGEPLVLANNAGPYLVTMGIEEAGPRVGLTINVTDDLGRRVEDAAVSIRAGVEGGGGEQETVARREAGRYLADVPRVPGRWNLLVGITPPGNQQLMAPFRFELPVSGARDILRRSDAAMNQLTGLRERQVIEGGPDGAVEGSYEYSAPDRMRVLLRSVAPGAQSSIPATSEMVVALGQRFDRQGDTWRAEPWPDPRGFRWPAYTFAQTATDVRLIGIEELEGRPHFVVTFAEPQGIRQTLWIDTQNYLVSQQRMMAPGHYMNATFYDVNEAISVEAPDS